MMTDELKPCPDCRHKAQLYENNFVGRHSFNIECKNCGRRTGEYEKEHELIAAWNRRAAPVTGWVSVDERLPEPDQEFLAWNEAKEMYLVGRGPSPAYFTHWQPLPPPPSAPACTLWPPNAA